MAAPTRRGTTMRREATILASALVLVTATAGWATSGTPSNATDGGAVERVAVRNVEGERIGTVFLRQLSGKVVVSARLHQLAPGFHGFHIHGTGACDADAPDGPFTTAGGHYNPDDDPDDHSDDIFHGEHPGDMPSLLVTDGGIAQLRFITDRFDLADLHDHDGSAVMVHEGPDNFANIPEDRYTSDEGPVPDSTTPIACSWCISASEVKKISIGFKRSPFTLGFNSSTPSLAINILLEGIT